MAAEASAINGLCRHPRRSSLSPQRYGDIGNQDQETLIEFAGWLLLAIAGLVGVAPFAGYPALVALLAWGRGKPERPIISERPSVTVITAFTGRGSLPQRKIANVAELVYPQHKRQLLLAIDGPAPEEASDWAREHTNGLTVRITSLTESRGKAYAINRALEVAEGEILVFSDLDAVLEPQALERLVAWFEYPDVGGVCGQRVIRKAGAISESGQRSYIHLDSWIKGLENRLGAITSNDGKLYAVRRSLVQPIQPDATDDLYNAITVVASGHRFLFEPEARAHIPPPAWDVGHELARRRRITVRSLSGMLSRPAILGLGRFGLFGVRLLINKILRRLLAVSLLVAIVGLLLLAPARPWAAALLVMIAVACGLTASYAVASVRRWIERLPRPLHTAWVGSFYGALGLLGTLLGLVDFAGGERIEQWHPRKTR